MHGLIVGADRLRTGASSPCQGKYPCLDYYDEYTFPAAEVGTPDTRLQGIMPPPFPFIAGSLGTRDSATLHRIKEGIERFLITDINNPAGSAKAQSTLPILLDDFAFGIDGDGVLDMARATRFNHSPGGSNVLFMDGHVEFVKYPGQYPLTVYNAYQGIGNKSHEADISPGFKLDMLDNI
jgi:prepilin-type processing-associated H-X9-DG protein